MSLSRRVAASTLCFLLAGLLLAQSDAIESWLAPPYWLPQKTAGVKNPDVAQPGLETQAVEGVPTPALAFTGIDPCRIVDTRGNGFTGTYGPPALIAGVARDFTLTGQCGISGTAQAVSLNITVTNPQGPGHLVIYPQGGAQPTVSTLNYVAGDTLANAAVVPLGAGGGITVVAGVSGTDLLIDTNGYYAPQTVVNTVNGLSGSLTLAPGSNISITPGGNTLTIAATVLPPPPAWSLTGNNISPGLFLGTTNAEPLELKVANVRAFRLEHGQADRINVIGGHLSNTVTPSVLGATISGGGQNAASNVVTDAFGTVAGGTANQAGDGAGTTVDAASATVGGGTDNRASALWATIAGGSANRVTDTHGTVAGGFGNRAGDQAGTSGDRPYGAVGGGTSNVASGRSSAVPGGESNQASGAYSFAAGRRAKATAQGSFVWADSTDADFFPSGINTFNVRASSGAHFVASTQSTLFLEQNGAFAVAEVVSNNPGSLVVMDVRKNGSGSADFLRCVNIVSNTGTKCHINSAGTFVAGSDFAEALPAKDGKVGYEPGDVLVVSSGESGTVEKSSRRCDPRAIGVYSTRPGFLGADKNGETRVDLDDIPVAITGIVPTKATAENGPIEPGDLLTTSSSPGRAMKASPVVLGVVEIYRPGTIVGKALDPLPEGEGVIRMLVTLR
jgi:hypothetical protein